MIDEPFFRRAGGAFEPTLSCRGPWDPNSLHGRVVAGLLGAEIEREHGAGELQLARLTIDLWRLPGFDPITVETRVMREGRRIKVVDAEASAAGVSVGRASAVLLRRGEAPPGAVWSPPDWDFVKPDALAPLRDGGEDPRPLWEVRTDGPIVGGGGRKRLWIREVRPLVDDEPLTPVQRAALAADLTNPLANSGAEGLGYINADITLYLHRLPVAEWIGFEVIAHHADAGVAVGECMLYDEAGAIGRSLVSALAQPRRA